MLATGLAILAFFVFRSGWYPVSELVIEGITPKPGIRLVVRWDSGEGFNDYERSHFDLNTPWPNGKPEHFIKIRRTGEKNERSHSQEILVSLIRLDDQKNMELDKLVSKFTKINENGFLDIDQSEAKIHFNALARHHILFEFPSSYHSGIVELEVNGNKRRFDLYTRNGAIERKRIDYWIVDPDGAFKISMPVPRYPVKTLVVEPTDRKTPIRFHSIRLISEYGIKTFQADDEPTRMLTLNNFNEGRNRFWHPILFILQTIFSILSTWILYSLWRIAKRYSGFRDIFINDKRYLFWLMFGCGVLVFSIWLIAFWPGVMSIDSLVIWRAAKFPEAFSNVHPILNEIFYMYLIHIWNHIAIVPIAQIILTSLLGAYIFFSLYRKGVRLNLLMPFYVLFLFSIPVGLYTITLWKDIPFALLILFWAYKISDMVYRRKRNTLSIKKEEWVVLFILYLSLAFFRHNGVVYLIAIPVIMVCLKILSMKQFAIGVISVAAIGAVGIAVVNSRIRIEGKGFFLEQAKHYANNLGKTSFKNITKKAASQYFEIFNINQKQAVWDLWHYYLGDLYSFHTTIKPAGWWDAFPFRDSNQIPSQWLKNLCLKIYEISHLEPWVYFSWDPFYMPALFLGSILLFKIFPSAAIFSLIIFVQLITLLLITSLNWRYYYFAFLSSYFLIPIMIVDLKNRFILSK